jgi:Lactoylglutathione lyase and related lyases
VHHCLVLHKSDAAHVKALSFKVYDEDQLDHARDWFVARGHTTAWVERPYQGRTLATHDHLGMPIEFYFQMDRLPPIHQKYALYKGVKPLRIDHFNCFVPDVDEAVDFYNEIGFRVTEYTEDEESQRLWAAWTHRKGGVHDIAFTNGLGPRLHHTAFWVPTPLNIIDLLDLMSTTGYVGNIERGAGGGTGSRTPFFVYIPRSRGAPDPDLLLRLPDGRFPTSRRSMGSEGINTPTLLWGRPHPPGSTWVPPPLVGSGGSTQWGRVQLALEATWTEPDHGLSMFTSRALSSRMDVGLIICPSKT